MKEGEGTWHDLATEYEILRLAKDMAWGGLSQTRQDEFTAQARRYKFPPAPQDFDSMKTMLVTCWVKAYREGSADAQARLVLHWLREAREDSGDGEPNNGRG